MSENHHNGADWNVIPTWQWRIVSALITVPVLAPGQPGLAGRVHVDGDSVPEPALRMVPLAELSATLQMEENLRVVLIPAVSNALVLLL